MSTLTVLDCEDNKVYQYQNLTDHVLDNVEDFLSGQGHNWEMCFFMTHADSDFITIKNFRL